MANRYYFSEVYEVVADTAEEAAALLAERVTFSTLGDDDPVTYLDAASGYDGMEEVGERCTCPPDLVARGGFWGRCPAHGVGA